MDKYQIAYTLLSGLIGSFITLIFTYSQYRHQFKLDNRSFISIDELTAGIKMKGLNLKPNTRLLVTDNYRKIEDQIKNGHIYDAILNYIKIKNLGHGIITDVLIQITCKTMVETNMTWEIKSKISLIESTEDIYLCLNNIAAILYGFIPIQIKIKYITLGGEKITFIRTTTEGTESNKVVDQYFVSSLFLFKRKLIQISGTNEEYIVVNNPPTN